MRLTPFATLLYLSSAVISSGVTAADELPTIEEYTQDFVRHDGFLPLVWDEDGGRLLMEIARFGEEMLYLPSLASGLGDPALIGLDKGTPGNEGILRFERVGPAVHVVLVNTRFRAEGGSDALARSVADSFPTSTLAALDVVARSGERVLVDSMPFFLLDVMGVAQTLERGERGSYRLDSKRSRIELARTRVFPENTEVEVALTFSSEQPGPEIRRRAPDARSLTLRQHHSFVELPGPGFRPRRFDPRMGVFSVSFYDFTGSFAEGYVRRFAVRHRLEKKKPGPAPSEPLEPIVYYLDPAVPEPYRTAFEIGAGWWSDMFEKAGFQGAFRIEDMPADMDPLDARYNVIQWFHRTDPASSVGPSFVDPRTGEILKAVVRMDSGRSLANYDLYSAILPALLASGPRPEGEAESFTMARRRQHAAHEVGHTLGLAHNFAAAFDERASVMAYPAPLIRLDGERVDISEAYAPGPGLYDEMVIRWAYGEFSPDDEAAELQAIVEEARELGLRFLTNPDERADGSHPEGTTWVNGRDAVEELARVLPLRRVLIERFDRRAIEPDDPMSLLWRRLTSVYLYHQTTLQAAIKAVGGMEYSYALARDPGPPTRLVEPARERRALELLLTALKPEHLAIPEATLESLAPAAFGYGRDPYALSSPALPAFDQLAAARVIAVMALRGLLSPPRVARLAAFEARDAKRLGVEEMIERILERTWEEADASSDALSRVVERSVVDALIELAAEEGATPEARAGAVWGLERVLSSLAEVSGGPSRIAHRELARRDIESFLERGERPPVPSGVAQPRRISLGDEPYCSFGEPPLWP